MGVYGNKAIRELKENIENEYVQEGVIVSFILLLFSPYIAIFVFILLILPIVTVMGKINESRVNKFLAKNPDFLKAVDDFGKSAYQSLCKIYPDNKKYLKYDFNKKISIRKNGTGDESGYIIKADIISINGSNILFDATGYKDIGKYLEFIKWDDPDADPSVKEFNQIIKNIKKSVEDLNKEIKKTFNNGNILVTYNDDINNDYILSSYGCYESGGISCDVNIGIEVKIKDFDNVKLPEPIKKKVNERVEKLRPKFKNLK